MGCTGSRTASDAASDFVEAPKKTAVTEESKAREIMRSHMDGLHERSLGENKTTRTQYALDFAYTTRGIGNVFKNCACYTSIKSFVEEGQIMCIGNAFDIFSERDIGVDYITNEGGVTRADYQDRWGRTFGRNFAHCFIDIKTTAHWL
jgi:hypothetical protein